MRVTSEDEFSKEAEQLFDETMKPYQCHAALAAVKEEKLLNVLFLIANKKEGRAAAGMMNIGYETLKKWRQDAYKSMGITSAEELVARADKEGWFKG